MSDTKLGTRHALTDGTRTPGLASPGTFPSRCFSHPQGFTPSSPLHPSFMMQPLIGFPSLVWTATHSACPLGTRERASQNRCPELMDDHHADAATRTPPPRRRGFQGPSVAHTAPKCCTNSRLCPPPSQASQRQRKDTGNRHHIKHTNTTKGSVANPGKPERTTSQATRRRESSSHDVPATMSGSSEEQLT
jgi:hypothetical protein